MSNSDQSVVQLRTPIQKWGRAILSGVIGMFVGAGMGGSLLFAIGPFTIFNEAIQSPKVNAVWGELEPLPLMLSNPLAFAVVLAILGAAHGVVFALVRGGLPNTTLKRGLCYGLIIWLMSILYFELQAPFSMLGEPLLLVGVELAIGLVGALVEGIVISWVYVKLTRN